MRSHGTEAPGSCALLVEKRHGKFSCAGCDQPLFESKGKFESGTGGPASMIRSRGLWKHPLTGSLVWSEPRFIAQTAAAILDTFLMTALHQPTSATASTESRWTSCWAEVDLCSRLGGVIQPQI